MELSHEEILVARAMCDRSLLFFTRLFFMELRGQSFQVNWHHETICEELEKVERYETSFLNINIPPRMGKTELVLNFIARGIGMNPRSNWFYITGSDTLQAETSVRIRDIVSCELFQKMYGVQLRKDMKARNLWRTEEGGGLKTATISGQITGFGAGMMTPEELLWEVRDFEGAIVMDDLNKMDDAEQENAKNDAVNRKLVNTVPSRVNSADTPVINIQQRAGEDDATVTLNEVYSGIFSEDRIKNLVLPILIDGEPLWASKMSLERIEKQRTSPRTAASFETQYMQNPQSPNEKPFHRTKLKYFTSKEVEEIKKNSEGTLSYCDPKDEGTDYYCHVLGHLIGETLYITDVIHNKNNTEVTVPKSVQMLKDNLCDYTTIESNAMGAMVFKQIKNESELPCYAVSNQTNKMTRIATNEAFIIRHMRFLEDPETNSDYETYMDILTKFEYGKKSAPDDAPDATAGLATLSMVKYRHLFQ